MGVQVREKYQGTGIWWVFIHHDGRRKSKMIGDEETAREVARRIEARIVLGEFNMDTEKKEEAAPLFRDYMALWLDNYIKPLRRRSTHNRYKWTFDKYIDKAIGKIPIDKIQRKDIRKLLLDCNKKGLSRASLALMRDVISGAMGYAVDDEIIASNPVSGIMKRLRLDPEKRLSVEPLNQDEANLFLGTCQAHFKEYHTFFLCALRTGMRLGELLALEWNDVDFNSKFLRVSKAFRRGRIEKTKNGKERRVDMSDHLYEALKILLTERKREALKSGGGEPVEIIFHKDGHHFSQNSIRNIFKRILKKAGLRHIRIHDLRHTFASLLLSNGESPVYVKEQLGHSSINITVDIYGHLIPSSNRDAVNRLDNPHPDRTLYAPTKIQKP